MDCVQKFIMYGMFWDVLLWASDYAYECVLLYTGKQGLEYGTVSLTVSLRCGTTL